MFLHGICQVIYWSDVETAYFSQANIFNLRMEFSIGTGLK